MFQSHIHTHLFLCEGLELCIYMGAGTNEIAFSGFPGLIPPNATLVL